MARPPTESCVAERELSGRLLQMVKGRRSI